MIEMPFREEFSELFIRGINGKGNVQESVWYKCVGTISKGSCYTR